MSNPQKLHIMKPKMLSLFILFSFLIGYTAAQDVITVEANSQEISNNLDLQAVASVFGDAEDLEDFERKLNDPELQISNLDMNGDGYVDYLRVVELAENNTHLIAIQAVLGEDIFQDVATIEVETDDQGVTTVQVVGDVYMYGPDYIIEPVYVHRPLIVVWFWGPHYRHWHSPWYWGYYPTYYRPWRPCHHHVYVTHIHTHINVHHTYHYTTVRKSRTAINMHHRVARNDYGSRHPEKSFTRRNRGVNNRAQLVGYKNNTPIPKSSSVKSDRQSKKVQKDWQTASKKGSPTKVKSERPSGTEKKNYKKPAEQRSTVQKQKSKVERKPASTKQKQPAKRKQSTPKKTTVKKTTQKKQSAERRTTPKQTSQKKQYTPKKSTQPKKSVQKKSSSTNKKPATTQKRQSTQKKQAKPSKKADSRSNRR